MMNNNRNQLNRSLLAFAALQVMPLSLFAQGERPNILYIMCDDHAMQAISAYGSPISKLAPTPNIDRLAERGMKFNEAFVENSLSTPSRACLMTGLYSHQNGQRQLAEGIDSTKTFFSELLQGAGYSTAVVGKWHMSCSPKGFDYYHVLDDQGQYYNPTFASTGQYGNFKQEMGYATDLITDHAIEYLNNRDKNKPFCLLVHHKAPHRLWMPNTKYVSKYANVNFPLPETFWDDYETRGSAASTQKMSIDKYMEMVRDLKVPEMYDPSTPEGRDSYAGLMGEMNRMTPQQRAIIDAYYMPRNREFLSKNLTGKELIEWKYQNYIRDYMAVIASVDESVGRLLEYLDKNNLTDNTIIVYTSDQGSTWASTAGSTSDSCTKSHSIHHSSSAILSTSRREASATRWFRTSTSLLPSSTWLVCRSLSTCLALHSSLCLPEHLSRSGARACTIIIMITLPTTWYASTTVCAPSVTS